MRGRKCPWFGESWNVAEARGRIVTGIEVGFPATNGGTSGRGGSRREEQDTHPISGLPAGSGSSRGHRWPRIQHLRTNVHTTLSAAPPGLGGGSLFLQGALTVSFPAWDHQGSEPPELSPVVVSLRKRPLPVQGWHLGQEMPGLHLQHHGAQTPPPTGPSAAQGSDSFTKR